MHEQNGHQFRDGIHLRIYAALGGDELMLDHGTLRSYSDIPNKIQNVLLKKGI